MNQDALSTVLTWLATYALHSTLLLLGAWALTRLPRLTAPRVAEGIWRTALFGGVLTASVHVFLGAPLWRAPLVEPAPVVAYHPPVSAPLEQPLAPAAVEAETPVVEARTPAPSSALPVVTPTRSPAWWLLLWPAGCALLWLRRRRGRRQLTHGLAARRVLASPELDHLLRSLERDAGLARRVRLTASPTLRSPMALGVFRPEVCLPERAVGTLDRRHLEVMLAHEVAHLARHDPLWLRAYRLTTVTLFFQPLNHLAVSRLRDCSEMLCDAWAAGTQPRRVALAECLTIVADWIVGAAPPAGAPAMARKASKLGARVHRLLDTPGGEGRGAGRAHVLALLPLLLVVAFAPGLGAVQASGAGDVPLGTPDDTKDDPVDALDRELALLIGEVAEVTTLLGETEHPELARRLGERLGALIQKRDTLSAALATENAR